MTEVPEEKPFPGGREGRREDLPGRTEHRGLKQGSHSFYFLRQKRAVEGAESWG